MQVSSASWVASPRPKWKKTLFIIIALGTLLVMIPLAILFAIAYGVACVVGWIGRTVGVRLGLARARNRSAMGGRTPNWAAAGRSSGGASPDGGVSLPGDDLRKNVRVRLPRSEE
jgi:hypothetical protein